MPHSLRFLKAKGFARLPLIPMAQKKIHLIMAARPNFMKVAPLYHALKKEPWAEPILVHTGQHYDANMSDSILLDLELPPPHHHLGVGSGSHAEQTGRTMIEYEKICLADNPDLVVVVGDVNATVACALVATKCGRTLAHLEAGLRSFDRTMPEEINRIVTDSISDILWTPSPDADENLIREGIDPKKIHRVGNIMIDSLVMLKPKFDAIDVEVTFGVKPGTYGVVTIHRPSNTDNPEVLSTLMRHLIDASEIVPLVFPLHPRTRKALEQCRLLSELEQRPTIKLLEPLSYLSFMALLSKSKVAITDSGGIQEETTYLGITCLTLRKNTERPITVTEGTNRLVGGIDLFSVIQKIHEATNKPAVTPALWDGQAAQRATAHIFSSDHS
jgi:UDP-N-acetylglucosamine 2-epimerase (non-hydrolysing)